MRNRRINAEALLKMVYQRKVVTKAEMIDVVGCSEMSLWRVISAHGYLTSYNFNAKYYTLTDIPAFDNRGLWFYDRIGFSKHGTLTETARHLIADSPQGLSCAELQRLLAVNVGPTLRALWRSGDLFREKHCGIFVYLAADQNRRRAQLSERVRRRTEESAAVPLAKVVIAVLVELIQRVELTPAEVSAQLSCRGMNVSEEQVQQVFQYYDLQPVKKGL